MKLKDILAAACVFALVAVAPAFAAKTLIKDNALASYYGAQYHGRPTSSGELFDMYGMSAAHRTLPYGTMLEITNLENGKSAIVRVNDRGPFVEGRELDVSLGAAEKLGMIASGVARVSISILDDTEVNARMPVPSPLTVASSTEQSAPSTMAAPVEQSTAPAEPAFDMPVRIVQAMEEDPAETAVPARPAPAPVPPLSLLPAPVPPAQEAPAAPAPAAPAPVPPAQEAPAAPAAPAYAQPAQEAPAAPAYAQPAQEAPAAPAYAQPAQEAPAETAVTAQPVEDPEPVAESEEPPIPSADSPVWRFQLGAFMREENAIRLVRQIRAVGIEPAYERNGETIRVVIAGVNNSDVDSVKSALSEAGLYDYIIRREK